MDVRDEITKLAFDKISERFQVRFAELGEISLRGGRLVADSGDPLKSYASDTFLIPKEGYLPAVSEKVHELLEKIASDGAKSGDVLKVFRAPIALVGETENNFSVILWFDCAISSSPLSS